MPSLSTTKRGDKLEKRIHDFFAAEIAADRFFAKASCCKVRKKPKYFSRDRGREIIFDVSIEIYLPGATEFSSVVLIECKNYTHSVPVDDAEEFFAKIQQVAAANAKGVIATSAAFQSGTRAYSKSKGIGLIRYFDREHCKWELMRSPSTGGAADRYEDPTQVTAGLSDESFHSDVFDFYLQSPTRETRSLWGFMEDLLLDGALSPMMLRRILNSKSKTASLVSFLEKDELEELAGATLVDLGYTEGEVSLDAICDAETQRRGLSVMLDVEAPLDLVERQVLGRIRFAPSRIEVFRQEAPNLGRARFTLAHELAHHLLDHGRYMAGEYCDSSDFALERSAATHGKNVARMEFQANYLAAGILMPKHHFVSAFRELARGLELSDRGFGLLYVDDQPCNLQTFDLVTRQLQKAFAVSHTAATIRLKSLGLLRDARKASGPRHALQGFSLPNAF